VFYLPLIMEKTRFPNFFSRNFI